MKIFNQSVFKKWTLEDNSIQSIITSPPYWGLRKYNIPDVIIDGWEGQYGLEKSYKSYIDHTRLWAKEAWRVLRDDGIMFLNIGDSFSSHKDCKQVSQSILRGKPSEEAHILSKGNSPSRDSKQLKTDNMKNKCKMLIPHRIAIALIDDGWILRNDIVWTKNCMPESITDRFSKKFESIFMFVKSEKYYFNLDIIRESYTESSINRVKQNNWNPKFNRNKKRDAVNGENTLNPKQFLKWEKGVAGQAKQGKIEGHSGYYDKEGNFIGNLLGKNPGDVWQINTQPSSEKHYAMWPEKLVERMILCSTKENDIILDPFCGSGTTLKVAIKNNRIGYGIDLGYSDIQERRLKNIQINLV